MCAQHPGVPDQSSSSIYVLRISLMKTNEKRTMKMRMVAVYVWCVEMLNDNWT